MIDIEAVDTALEELRTLVQADGGDMVWTSTDDTSKTVNLSLVLEGASCIECVMPKMFLEQIALDSFKRANAGVDAVSIFDPREDDPDFVMPEH